MKNVKIEGVEELINSLAKTEEEMLKASRRANIAGAKVVAEELEKNVPVSGYKGKNSQPIMKDNVVTSGNRLDQYTQRHYIAVGFPKGVAHRVHFPEFGSISQSPQFYFAKTIDATPSKVQNAMADEVKKVFR